MSDQDESLAPAPKIALIEIEGPGGRQAVNESELERFKELYGETLKILGPLPQGGVSEQAGQSGAADATVGTEPSQSTSDDTDEKVV